MLDDGVQAKIGERLRAMYEDLPKGPIPDELWDLLLLMERKYGVDIGAQVTAPPPSATPSRRSDGFRLGGR